MFDLKKNKRVSGLLRRSWISSGALLPAPVTYDRNTYLFLPINGAGLGHVSRALAVAKALRREKPEARIIFLTTSIAVHLVYREGFTCHHVPPAALLDDRIGAAGWNRLFYRCVAGVLATHRPGTLIFDGSTPYIGLQRIMRRFRSIRYVWIKRGLYKSNVDQQRLDAEVALFDRVIVPAEFGVAEEYADARTSVFTVPPIIGLERQELLSSDEVNARLRLDPARRCAYVQLGAGNINGIADIQARVVRILRARGYQVVVGNSPIALRPQRCDEADQEIVDYPNSRYFAGFEFAVLAAGYNSVCEAVALGLPAIFIPNLATQSDDQVMRATLAAGAGQYEVVTEFSDSNFSEAVSRISNRVQSHEEFSRADRNGARDAALLVIR